MTLDTPPKRKRLTARSPQREAESAKLEQQKAEEKEQDKVPIEKVGSKGEVVIVGRRIRCKMCRSVCVCRRRRVPKLSGLTQISRRELAGREHIIVHEPGKGQQAFAPHRRDMAAHRAETEARRQDELDREKRGRQPGPAVSSRTLQDIAQPDTSVALQPPTIAGLRISQPRQALPGARAAVTRPQPMARPDPAAAAGELGQDEQPKVDLISVSNAATSSSATADTDNTASEPQAVLPHHSIDPPLLPSHMCSSYFVEPLSWMSPILESGVLAGKLVCPGKRCGAKLGSFDWAGAREWSDACCASAK